MRSYGIDIYFSPIKPGIVKEMRSFPEYLKFSLGHYFSKDKILPKYSADNPLLLGRISTTVEFSDIYDDVHDFVMHNYRSDLNPDKLISVECISKKDDVCDVSDILINARNVWRPLSDSMVWDVDSVLKSMVGTVNGIHKYDSNVLNFCLGEFIRLGSMN